MGSLFVCVFTVCRGMITLSGKSRQQCLFNSVIDSTGIESGRGKKHFSANLVNRAWQANCR